MGLLIKVVLIPLLIQSLCLVSLTICQSQLDFLYYDCLGTHYVNPSTYKANLDTALSSISSKSQINNNGFYEFSTGMGPDLAAAIGLCRGDLTAEDCHTCLHDSTVKLPQLCPTNTEAIIWYDHCMLRYANQFLLGIYEIMPGQSKYDSSFTDSGNFSDALHNLWKSFMTQAAWGNSKMFAAGEATVNTSLTLYALTQCTPDLSQSYCSACLTHVVEGLTCCDRIEGLRSHVPSCNVRFQKYRFYNLPITASPPSGNGSSVGRIAIIVAVPTVVLVALAIILYCLFRRRKTREKVVQQPNERGETAGVPSASSTHVTEDDESRSVTSVKFDFHTIIEATNNFSDANKLGRGGFGPVYEGRLANGQDIAVKRMSNNTGQGDTEFMNEVVLVAKLQHRNLVRLLGFCAEEEERLLVYEYVANSSLDQFLFDPIKSALLDWEKRYKIMTGIARGLQYLHEDSRLRIIHRDLKAGNILLDVDMNPKIADLGVARLFRVDQTRADTRRIIGTYGYMAPEYALHGLFSVKSDVYSFGVLILQIITGREHAEDLVSFVWRNWREDTTLSIIDPILSTGPKAELMRCIQIGLLCVQESAEYRPTMSSVVVMLSTPSLSLPAPSLPAHAFIPSSGLDTTSDQTTKGRTTEISLVSEASRIEMNPR